MISQELTTKDVKLVGILNVIFRQICPLFQSYVYQFAENNLSLNLIQQIADLLTKIGLVGTLL